jgi:hypothetical protein
MAADPITADVAAKRNGVPVLERIRALRTEFGLSLAAAKAVIDATEGRQPVFPEVTSLKQLEAVLEAELGYCNCASGAALIVLREFLHAVRRRSDAVGNAEEFARASQELNALMAVGGGWAEWLVYGLEQRGFIWHGFRQTDLCVTDKGRLLLRALESFGTE